MADNVLARIAALKKASLDELRQRWRDLMGTPAPGLNRRAIEARLAYRIQEIAYGGLDAKTIARLENIGEAVDGKKGAGRKKLVSDRPVTGTKLLRQWQGVEQVVTVLVDGFEWNGKPYKSLSAVARAITGTRWNGLMFFGLKTRSGG